ncbi:hypothetical protein BHM03_00029929 [Ensete ventricosum]|nr:hypothetical protein BHM03_00029929 [Ensete ventricosum]
MEASGWGLNDAVGARRELAGSTPGVHRKMIKRLAGSSLKDAEKFAGSSKDQLTCRIRMLVVPPVGDGSIAQVVMIPPKRW